MFEKFKILKIRDSHYQDKLIPYTIMSDFCFLLETPIYDNFWTELRFFVENAKHALHKTILEPPLIIFLKNQAYHSMRNEKLGKVTKFHAPTISIKWTVHEKPQGGAKSAPPPDTNRVNKLS